MIWNHLNISTCRTQVKGAKIYNKCKIFVFCTSAKINFSLWHILIHPYLSYFANFSELRAGRAYQFGVKIMLINCCQKIWSAGVSLKNIIIFFWQIHHSHSGAWLILVGFINDGKIYFSKYSRQREILIWKVELRIFFLVGFTIMKKQHKTTFF